MPKFTIKTTILCFILFMVASFTGGRSVHKPPDIQVRSPSEFNGVLPSVENGKLLKIRLGVNKPLEIGLDNRYYPRSEADGKSIRFLEKDLNLKKGDTIYYSLESNDGQDGRYIFDRVFKLKDRRKREIFEDNSEEDSVESHEQDRPSRHGPPYDDFRPRGPPRRPPHGPFNHHGHRRGHHGHLGSRKFGAPPQGQPKYPGPGPWNHHGYDNNKHGNNGPWNGYDEDADNCGSNQSNPRHPGSRPDNKKPWTGSSTEYPYFNGGNNNNNGNYDDEYPYGGDNSGNRKPDKGYGFENKSPGFNKDDSGKGIGSSKSTENPNAQMFTTRKTSTTPRISTDPNIDIRFRVPEQI